MGTCFTRQLERVSFCMRPDSPEPMVQQFVVKAEHDLRAAAVLRARVAWRMSSAPRWPTLASHRYTPVGKTRPVWWIPRMRFGWPISAPT